MRFSLLGFPIEIQSGAFLFAGVIFLFQLSTGQPIASILMLISVGAFSILVHEFGHALTARAFTNGPVEIALVSMGGLTRHPRIGVWWKALIVILAGPFAGFALALLAFVGLLLPLPVSLTPLLELLVLINVVWGIFNLIPLYPLDGGHALAQILLRVMAPMNAAIGVHVVGLLLAVGLAAMAYWQNSLWTAMFVAMFGYQNWQGLQVTLAHRRALRTGPPRAAA